MSGALYSRRYEVVLGTLARPNLITYGNTAGAYGAKPSYLRCEFEIEKTCTSASNKGMVRLTNMAPNNRANIRLGLLATLSVGYDNQMQTLFVGGVAKTKTERQGPDIVTTLEMGDGEASIQNVIFDKTYGANTLLTQVLTDLCQAMQLPSTTSPKTVDFNVALGMPLYRFSKGFTAHGPARDTLNSLCQTFGLEWSMQNYALQIVPLKNHTGQTAEVLSPKTGLIGVPSFDGTVATFTCLLNPRLAPGRLVAVKTGNLNGFFKIRKGKWTGDSHGQAWVCELEAIPLPALQTLIPSTGLPLKPDVGA